MTQLTELDVLFVDCQTTGATPEHGSMIELGWARWRPGESPEPARARAECSPVRLPEGERMSARIAEIVGIDREVLDDAPPLGAVWTDVCDAAEEVDRLVAHYARFEERFFRDAAERVGREPSAEFLCTHRLVEALYPGLPRRGLRTVAGFFGHPVDEPNRAEAHVRATAVVWERLVEAVDERLGAVDVDELEERLAESDGGTDGRTYALERSTRLALPEKPGVYRLLDADGEPLYIGKAASLRDRVNSYFQTRAGLSSRKLEMVPQVHDVEVRPTATPLEAAIAESDAIKEEAPPYNEALTGGGELIEVSEVFPSRRGPRQDWLSGVRGHRALLRRGRALASADADVATDVLRPVVPAEVAPEALTSVVDAFRAELEERGAEPLERLERTGLALWPPEDGQDDDENDATGEEAVREACESIVRNAAREIRLGIWLERLSGAALAWRPMNWEDRSSWRAIRFDAGAWEEAETLTDEREAESWVDGYDGERGAVATWEIRDRLRVCTTHIRTLVRRGRPTWLSLPDGASLDAEAVRALLELV